MFFILITLVIYYIIIFSKCFVNCNFEFMIEIKGRYCHFKKNNLIKHKIYEISLMKHIYYFFV